MPPPQRRDIAVWYASIPAVTRAHLTFLTVTTLAVTFEFVRPHNLHLSLRSLARGQVWRLVTPFLFFDRFSVNFFFHMLWLYQFSRQLEEQHWRRRSARLLFLTLCGGAAILVMAVVAELTLGHSVPFLSHSLVVMTVYWWGVRFPDEWVSLYGIFNLQGRNLCFAIFGAGLLFGQSPVADVIGIGVGAAVWWLEETLPARLHHAAAPVLGDGAAPAHAAAGGAAAAAPGAGGGPGAARRRGEDWVATPVRIERLFPVQWAAKLKERRRREEERRRAALGLEPLAPPGQQPGR